MNQFKALSITVLVALLLAGCGQKQKEETFGDAQSVDASLNLLVADSAMMEKDAQLTGEAYDPATLSQVPAAVDQMAGSGASITNPTPQDIQQALKNAGLYSGDVDGKIGPKTKRAIREFKTANNLKIDGKVGPQTWAKLAPYYDAPQETATVVGIAE